MNYIKAVKQLESLIKNPEKGLPEEVFLFISRMTPLVNVDLLIKDKKGNTLLTWREDKYFGKGWHIPGGIIRYKESISNRIAAVAKTELGAKVSFNHTPLQISEFIDYKRNNRAHGISLLYACSLLSPPEQTLEHLKGLPLPGQWRWHQKCPPNILEVHRIYQDFI